MYSYCSFRKLVVKESNLVVIIHNPVKISFIQHYFTGRNYDLLGITIATKATSGGEESCTHVFIQVYSVGPQTILRMKTRLTRAPPYKGFRP
jgi:hypothetical protein